MKKKIYLQLIISLLLLLSIMLIQNIRDRLLLRNSDAIIENQVKVFINKYIDALTIADTLSIRYEIKNVEIIKNSDLFDQLIKKYKLDNASLYLDKQGIPNKLTFSFFAGMDSTHVREITEFITVKVPSAKLDFDKDRTIILLNEFIKNKHFFNFLLIALIIIIAVVLIYQRIFKQINQDHYWKIFFSCGGKPGTRKKEIILTAILQIVIPLLFIIILFLIDQYLNVFKLLVDYKVLTLMVIAVISAELISLIQLRKRFK